MFVDQHPRLFDVKITCTETSHYTSLRQRTLRACRRHPLSRISYDGFLFALVCSSLKHGILFTFSDSRLYNVCVRANTPPRPRHRVHEEERTAVLSERSPCCFPSCQRTFSIKSCLIWITDLSVASLKFVKLSTTL